MIIFATPDFGASGGICFFLLIVWAIIFVLVAGGIGWGARLLRAGSSKAGKWGGFLLIASGILPLFCCLAPPHVVRIFYGNYPIGSYPNGKITEGMSTEEVSTILGPPHERYRQGAGEHWYYWIDSFSIRHFGVRFGPDGRVVQTYGN